MEYKRNFYQIKNNEEIFKLIEEESKVIGYYDLPFLDTKRIKDYSSNIEQKNIFVIGIGGSSLGSKAIYQFLLPKNKLKKKLFFLDTIDPLKINHCLSDKKITDSHFIVISKSGRTIEPISILKYISSHTNLTSKNCTVISGKDTPLANFATKLNLAYFEIDENIGGRFSVFSPVGLVPLSIVGVDIELLLEGCREVHESFFNKTYYYDHIINKARFIVENKSRFNINVIFSYSSIFEGFNKWFIQLWAESIGKRNINGTRQGLTPVALLGPDDQHSFLQLIIDGPRDKTVTFFKILDLDEPTIIPESSSFKEFDLDFISNKSFNYLLNCQADATYESIIREKDIPCDVVTIPSVDEKNIAKLMYRYQLLVSSIGAFLQINTYNQPGVEYGKKFLKEKLQK